MREIRVVVVRDRKGSLSAPAIRGPVDACKLLADKARGIDREHFWVIHVSARNVPISVETVSIGTLSASLVHPREVFKGAIVSGAAGIILGHNHPSSDMEPSSEDIAVTRRLVRVGAIVGIPVLDHIVLDGLGNYLSLKDRRSDLFVAKDGDNG